MPPDPGSGYLQPFCATQLPLHTLHFTLVFTFSLALMHVVVHLLYKAHAFLKSGSTVDSVAGTRSIAMIEWTRNQTLSKLIPAVAIYISIARCMAIDLATKPGYLVLGVMIVLALAQHIGPSFFTRSVGFHVSCNGNCRDELQRQMRRLGTISTLPSH